MTTKTSRPAPQVLPYRRILPDGFICPQREYLREDMLQAEPIDESGHLLRDHFRNRPNTLVDTGGIVFYDPEDLGRRQVRPDVYIVFGIDTESVWERLGYIIDEAGKPPDFVLEVASRRTYRTDLRDKPGLYARIGVSEYWRFDPSGGNYYGSALAGDILAEGVYQPIELTQEPDGMLWGYSPALDLCLCASGKRLMYYDRKTGRYLNNIREEREAHLQTAAERDAAQSAHLRAAAERDAAQSAHLRAAAERDAAQSEVERLQAELRRLRGE